MFDNRYGCWIFYGLIVWSIIFVVLFFTTNIMVPNANKPSSINSAAGLECIIAYTHEEMRIKQLIIPRAGIQILIFGYLFWPTCNSNPKTLMYNPTRIKCKVVVEALENIGNKQIGHVDNTFNDPHKQLESRAYSIWWIHSWRTSDHVVRVCTSSTRC